MGVQGGYAPLKIHLNLKTYSPSRACEVKDTFRVWAREGGRGVGCTRPEQTGRRDQGGGHRETFLPCRRNLALPLGELAARSAD